MYGLKQAAIQAYNHLRNSLAPYGYKPIPGTVEMQQHKTRPTKFCVCVDDFGIKYSSREDRDHLCNSIGKTFQYTTDYEGNNYCGLHINWDYKLGYVDISMPDYVNKTLTKLHYPHPTIPEHSTHAYIPI